ncbi:tetrapyrrole biosynthesis uroporphyrinogen III synthase [Rickenella mellea]|uniref:Tetrapyrrole biosynthesis uroporphyrinogen III synthase n=1 Tax=Rickenella mellea TaxID=50990 RepID=A0A4Y7QH85_9AGAM|nr:tetrapyrrole biosynthesis uroporphyrinogen III synthase [Rickenella mellea]
MINVLLLRSPSSDGKSDPYGVEFSNLGYQVQSLAVLETVQSNPKELQEIIRAGPASHDIHGVIITSKRASDAWRDATTDLTTNSENMAGDWSDIPFYVVGESTSRALKDIGLSRPSHLTPNDIRGATESGTSERLAHFILSEQSHRENRFKFLYLKGDKNRDDLPNILVAGGITLVSVKVYETRGSPSFATTLQTLVNAKVKGKSNDHKLHWWVVLFAPSAAEFAVPILRTAFRLSVSDGSPDSSLRDAKIAAIGPTTASYLRNKLSLDVAVVSAKPEPVELVKAVFQHDQQRRQLV